MILRIVSLTAAVAAYTAPTRTRAPARRTTAPPRPWHPAALSFDRANATAAAVRLDAAIKDPKDKKGQQKNVRGDGVHPVGSENNVVELPSAYSEDGRKAPSEFELNLGRAIDAIRADVPEFADRELQWDIYTPNVQLADPTGVQTRGLSGYKQFFGLIRMFRRVMIDDVDITFKLRYDWSGKKIVVTWYSAWTARGSRTPAHVDAVSYFHLDDAGKVFKHEVDRVQVGGRPLNPPYSVGWLAFREYVLAGLDGGGGAAPAGVAAYFRSAFDAVALEQGVSESRAASASSTEDENARKRSENMKKARAADKKKRAKLLPGACENMWDCESPQECCDFVMFKMCCSGGVGIPAFMQPSLVPIPIPVERDPPFPDGYGGDATRW